MSETDSAIEPEGSGESAARGRTPLLRRYVNTLASIFVRPRLLRKETDDAGVVLGPYSFLLATFAAAVILQWAVWQQDPLVATFEAPTGLLGPHETVVEIDPRLKFLPLTPLFILVLTFLAAVPLFWVLRAASRADLGFAAFFRPYLYSQTAASGIGIVLLLIWFVLGTGEFGAWALIAFVLTGFAISIVYVIPAYWRLTKSNLLLIAVLYFAYNIAFSWSFDQVSPVRNFNIESTSMLPNLEADDIVAVNRWVYWWRAPVRGEIVIFRQPQEPSTFWVKRLIGFPGEKIAMRNGELLINDKPARYEQVEDYSNENRSGDIVRITQKLETLPNGARHAVLDRFDNSRGDNTETFDVPEGHYFVMGDHRDNSTDSRFDLGTIPAENLIGPVYTRLFPIGRQSYFLTP